MATRTGALVEIMKGVKRITWEGFTTASDVGNAMSMPNLPDKTVTVYGTFSGATIVLQGSNLEPSASSWFTLDDTRGESNALSFTASDMRTILQNPKYIRPKLTSATGSPDIDVSIVARGTK